MTRSLAATFLAALSLASGGTAAQAPGKPLYAEGRMLVLVPPDFPRQALEQGRTAMVEVFGTIRTDGLLEGIRIEATPPIEAFESAVMEVAPMFRLQPRIDAATCGAFDTSGHVTFWFEIADAKPKVSYGVHAPTGSAAPEIHVDRKPVHMVNPLYPARLARSPNAPREILQVAYVAVAGDGAVTGVTLAPMLHYREFEPLISAAVRQWKFAPQASRWCGEVSFNMTLK
ncbi:MAG TPA: hypothetical protein PK042_04525 [Usitatibacteraceae bacterium]|nr:hypothetical protein [Usitatibacteraceae bacterium]